MPLVLLALFLLGVDAVHAHGIPRVYPQKTEHPEPIEDGLRILLFDLTAPIAVTVSSKNGPVNLYAGDEEYEIARIEPGASAVIRRASNQLHVTIGSSALYATSIRVEPAPGALIGLKVNEGSSSPEKRHFAGRLSVTVDENEWELKLINEVGLEEYVAAVIATEYGFDDLEGAKAMAVIIRTYALAALGKFGPDYDHVDHTLSQVYHGSDSVTPTMRRAVAETRGQVLTYDNKLIEAVYFSTSGGHTADNESVWQSDALPYLRGKPDPYGKNSPHQKWSAKVPRTKLLAALSAAYGTTVTGFVISNRAANGRVSTVELLQEDGGRRRTGANEFRMNVIKYFGASTLRSTMFEVRRDGDQYVFEGSGYGHGVGLSQWGAHDLAQRGVPYTEILDFYYTGVTLETLDELGAGTSPRPVASKEEPRTEERARTRIGW